MNAHLDWRTLLKAQPDTDPKILDALEAYFAPFAQPPGVIDAEGKFIVEKGHPCLRCGEMLTGMLAMMLGKGGFQWGLAHGEGRCSHCGWPARAHHFITDADGEKVFTVHNFVLQYHPDALTDEGKKRIESRILERAEP